MKTLTKTAKLGEKKFTVATNRDIAVNAFEKYPEETKQLLKFYEKDSMDKLVDALENKRLKNLLDEKDNASQNVVKIIDFALPLMLKAADDKSDADELIKYAKEKNALVPMAATLFDFLSQGFTLDELGTPEVQFVLE